MSVDTIKFVDSIAASPTVRLDVNDGTVWRCGKFDAPPPRLRRAVGQNAMRDGIFVSSSQYDARVVTLELALVHSSEDNAATELQKLARELDRADNFLMYQPTGASKPVFFRLFRSDMSQIEQFTGGASAFKKPTIELLAEPFALGLRETLGPFTVNNDPAAGSNGLYFDVTGVIGDAVAPCILTANASSGGLERYGWMSVRQHGTPSDLSFFVQAESSTLGTDTTNPGGGPDAAMSGAGTNNFVRCSFATATMVTRLTATFDTFPAPVDARGRYRILVAVRRSDNTSAMTMRLARSGAASVTPGSTVTLPLTTNRRLIDLGIFDNSFAAPERVGFGLAVTVPQLLPQLQAARSSGAGTLDFDYVLALPADESSTVWDIAVDLAADPAVFDGMNQAITWVQSGTNIFTGSPWSMGADIATGASFTAAGGFPSLVPNQTNRIFVATERDGRSHNKADTNTFTVDYWPRYALVRPSAT